MRISPDARVAFVVTLGAREARFTDPQDALRITGWDVGAEGEGTIQLEVDGKIVARGLPPRHGLGPRAYQEMRWHSYALGGFEAEWPTPLPWQSPEARRARAVELAKEAIFAVKDAEGLREVAAFAKELADQTEGA